MLPQGYDSSPASYELADELTALINRYDTRNGVPPDLSVDDVKEMLRAPASDLANDSVVVKHGDQVVAAAWIRNHPADGRATVISAVDPDHNGMGLGSFLFEFIESRGLELVRRSGDELAVHLFVDVGDKEAVRMAEERGFSHIRDTYMMNIDLDDIEPVRRIPAGVTLKPGARDDARLLHEMDEEIFADHFGFSSQTFEDWEKGLLARGDLDPTLWWVAYYEAEPAGFLLGCEKGDMGWVAVLGVRKARRRRGIATAMLHEAFAQFQRRGLRTAGLGVDAQNESRPLSLYQQAGMKVIRDYGTFEKKYSSI